MELTEKILQAKDSPKELEVLYHEDQESFKVAFPDALKQNPDSVILQVWNERLWFLPEKTKGKTKPYMKDIVIILAATILLGTFTKLPQIFKQFDFAIIDTNLPSLLLFSIISYYLFTRSRSKAKTTAIIMISVGLFTYLNLIPQDYLSDSILLAKLHLPFLFWLILGATYLGDHWKDVTKRRDFIRYTGETLMFLPLLGIGTLLLILLIQTLFFDLLPIDYDSIFLVILEEYFIVYLAVSLPLVATFLTDKIFVNNRKIASVLSKFFTPFITFIVTIFLIGSAVTKQNPFQDRGFLIIFNFILFFVLGLSCFSIYERPQKEKKTFSDYTNFALIAISIIINSIALSSIIFRLSSYGMTPNRLAVLGINLLFFGHLLGILFHMIRFIFNRGSVQAVENWISKYFPIYSIWLLFVIVGIPLIFNFK